MIGVFFLFILTVSVLVEMWFGKIHLGSVRAYFFAYIFLVALFSILLCRYRKISWILIMLFAMEFGLAALSSIGGKLDLIQTLMPPDDQRSGLSRYTYHSLLQARPTPNWKSKAEPAIRHNSIGLRGAEISPEILKNSRVIFAYGGSTTYDIGIGDGHTWTDQLQSRLGSGFVIANFGVPGQSTVEHVIQTVFYANLNDRKPDCAVYYVGWNDIRNAHLPNLDPGYADFHLVSQIDNLQARAPQITTITPLVRIGFRLIQRLFDPIPLPPRFDNLSPKSGSDVRLEENFKRNIGAIVAVNTSRGVRSIFIGQMLNREQLTSEKVHEWLPLVKDKDVWPLQERFNAILQASSAELGAHYIALDIDDFSNGDFVDSGHFSNQGAEKFAKLIEKDVRATCSR